MGVPSDGNMTLTNGFTAHNNWYGFFVHDDWKVARRLTMNIGLRYELDMPLTERDDRMVNGFDLTTPSPIVFRSRSGYFERAFSACSFVLYGFDRGVNSPLTYLKSNHCSIVLGISNL